jgi:acetyl-CoA acetyltransferase
MAVTDSYITGVGQSEVGIRLKRDPLLLTVDAIKEALDDAGLTLADIDGISTYPGKTSQPPGFSPVGAEELIDALHMKVRWYTGAGEYMAQLGAVIGAAGAVGTGRARHVICFRTVYEAGAIANPVDYPQARGDGKADGMMQWMLPYNAMSAANWVAQYASIHMHKYGLKREQLAQIALTDRANGLLNPRALVREALTLDQYMESRMITSPLCLNDCDRFTDCSTVLIVSSKEGLADVKSTPVRIANSAFASERFSWDQQERMSSYTTGAELWRNTDYKPKDVDTVQFYDGFSFLALSWFEALGFCGLGEGGEFISNGRIALDGELPFNTFGGQIAGGRLHGFGFAHEAVTQLRGQGGARQIKGDPKVAVATSGGGPMAAALLLARD